MLKGDFNYFYHLHCISFFNFYDIFRQAAVLTIHTENKPAGLYKKHLEIFKSFKYRFLLLCKKNMFHTVHIKLGTECKMCF
jgi:hypothetical protein